MERLRTPLLPLDVTPDGSPSSSGQQADDNIHLRAIEIVLQMATKIVEAEIFLLKEI